MMIGTTTAIIAGHQAKDLTIRKGRASDANIHFDNKNIEIRMMDKIILEKKSMHSHCLMYQILIYIYVKLVRLIYLDVCSYLSNP